MAATTWTRRTPTTVRALACWNEAPQDGNSLTIGARFGREDPVETCRRYWGSEEYEEYGVTGPLVTCVADYGTAVVIPGADETACDAAGLDRFDGRIPEELLAIRDVEDELSEQVAAGRCFDEAAALAAVREALDRHGLDDWTVIVTEAEGLDGVETCAVFAFEEATSTASVVFVPKAL